MRIQSYQKIDKQAQRYSELNFVDMPPEWYDHYNTIDKKYNRLRDKWNIIREKCPGNDNGNKCICQTFPEYESLMIHQMEPLVKQLNDMWTEKYNNKRSLYLKELRNLQRMREAKENYYRTH